MLPHDRNAATQPCTRMPVFGNWDVVARGWTIACRSDRLPRGGLHAVEILGQRLVVFRGEDGATRALDAFCPHMGTDLAEGRVVGNTVRCFFHHWRFDGDGACVHIPALPDGPVPARARLHAWATCERYGYVWVWPDRVAPSAVAEFEGLEGADLVVWHDHPYERTCHHHVCMINGIDPQHLATVHGIHIQMDLRVDESSDGRMVDYTLTGDVPDSRVGRLLRRIIGPRYRYAMRYADGNLGLLTTVKELRLGGRGPHLPELHMLYAYTPIAHGRVRVQPVIITRRRPGLLGYLWARLLLYITLRGFRSLQGEDGRVYDNMRFSPTALLPIDAPVARFIAYVNRLTPSVWSRPPAGPEDPP